MSNTPQREELLAKNERVLVGLWQEIIGEESITAESDFFQLGGDSLQMMTMLFRVQEELGVELTPGSVFDNPTLGQLAAFLAMEQMRDLGEAREGTL